MTAVQCGNYSGLCDKMKVLLLDPAGTTLATVATYSNLDKTTGWVKKGTFSLLAFRG